MSRHVTNSHPWGVIEWLAGAEIGNSAELSIARVVLDAGSAMEPHVHGNCEESVFVVSGTVECASSGRTTVLEEGEQAIIGRGDVHVLRNPNPEPTELLLSYSSAAREFAFAPDQGQLR